MTTTSLRHRLFLVLGATGLLSLSAAPAALAGPRGWRNQPTYVLVPVQQQQAARTRTVVRTVDRSPRRYTNYPVQTLPYRRESRVDQLRADLERDARRCNTGRLVGGLLGGGAGYVASQDEGRAWAVPLGALLGSQVGCNVGNGRTPLPW